MNVLIIGKNSYIGSHIQKHLSLAGHRVWEFDVEHEPLNAAMFENVDSVVHVAAIVHRKDITDYSIYKKINVDLPYEVARLAKESKVKQFVFLRLEKPATTAPGTVLAFLVIAGFPFLPQEVQRALLHWEHG